MTSSRRETPQRAATSPDTSAWVAANAGSGKTHVLVERIARLLLDGSPPDRLLCLTFTRAAASEMATRLFKRLGTWTLVSDEELADDITELTGDVPTEEVKDRARRLFADALESPGGLRIQTIHAFCERLLKRFPLEGGVVPQFSVLDERATEELLDAAKDQVLLDATTKDADLADSITELTQYAGEERFDELIRSVASERSWVEPFVNDKSRDVLRADLWKTVGLDPATDERSVIADAVAAFGINEIRKVGAAFELGGKSDKARVRDIKAFADNPTAETFAGYLKVFLTGDMERRARFATKDVLAIAGVKDILERHADIAEKTRGRINALFVARTSLHLLHVAGAILKAYNAIKARRAMLDYDDLIAAAGRLFESPGASWILYKLDGGIDHILVDEAQDTSPSQWAIIKAIAAEFFAGLGAERKRSLERTVFAVGDVKQSIMSFQGARPKSFVDTRDVISDQALSARAEFELIPLVDSYRSAPAIMNFVDAVFGDATASDGVKIDGNEILHKPLRTDMRGIVELWPVVPYPKLPDQLPWDAPKDRVTTDHPAVTLAGQIADQIRVWLAGSEVVFDRETKKPRRMTAGDIMILVRRRNLLAEEIIRQLKARAIPVAGADRLKLIEHIAVMDLIALGRFALMPHDDLTLAALLKSPLCGIDEDALFEIAHGREKKKLWSVLQTKAEDPRFAACVAFLRRARDQADVLQPYEFYANVLGELGGWTKMLARLGFDAADPIEEFLNAALDFERANTPSLEAFLHSIETTQIEIKRDQDRGAGAVRVMTVHASKGLEAPVVILPDTCMTPRHGMLDKNLLDAGKTPLWKLEKKRDDPVRRAARDIGVDERMKEYRRLLYVALTRARDRLYICGHDGRLKREADCWYNLIEKAMGDVDAVAVGEGITRFGEATQGAAPTIVRHHEWEELPPWARERAQREAVFDHVAPSIIQARQAVKLAVGTPAANSLERGRAIHRALERLASAPSEKWGEVAFEATSSLLADEATAQAAANEALKVRRDLLLSHIFAPPSYGEVPLSGVVEWRGAKVDLAARLDRVVVGKDDVLIVEYKTDKVVPKADSAIPKSYVTQLALYRLAVARLFEGRTVSCGILWTAEARLSILPSRLLHEAERALDPLSGAT